MIASVRLPDGGQGDSATLFEELPVSVTGVDFVQPIDLDHPYKCIYVGGYASPGLAIGDLNGDGAPDLFVTGGDVAGFAAQSGQRPDVEAARTRVQADLPMEVPAGSGSSSRASGSVASARPRRPTGWRCRSRSPTSA